MDCTSHHWFAVLGSDKRRYAHAVYCTIGDGNNLFRDTPTTPSFAITYLPHPHRYIALCRNHEGVACRNDG